MIPRPHQALNDLAGRIGTRVLPELSDPFTMADTGLISLLMSLLGQELEHGVANRMADGEALKQLFAEAPGKAPGADARTAFIDSQPTSLILTDVTAWLDQGLTLLIALHAWAEESDDDLNRRIWSFLADHTERHKFDF
ncbi:MAG: hypothetical protein EP301_05960 [Gammaproteobacteria bacterium]|jgi:hypothetical protein|nr:MAG: hypothetical protein EP301_05960 [Gammaproteobacteria bacterium]